jgi:hypothetical protein
MGQEQAMVAFVAVIADDLTGVCDTGAQFASAGLRTVGSVDQESIPRAEAWEGLMPAEPFIRLFAV